MRTFADRAEFATDRLAVLDRGEQYLTRAVASALAHWGDAHWFYGLVQRAEDLFDRSYREEAGSAPTDTAVHTRAQLGKELADALDHTREPSKFTAETLARYVATSAINAATEAAAVDDDVELVLEWVSMHDEHVRPTHRRLDGQQRRIGEPFHIGDVEIRRPGDVRAPIEEWINCRCVLRADAAPADALVAAGGAMTEAKPSVIVALPHPDDPVHGMGTEPSHVTLCYLGNTDEVEDPAAINDAVSNVAGQVKVPQMSDAVSGTGTLGPDKANVLLMDGHHLGGLRNALLDHPAIKAAHDSAQQHPHWIPHLTVGYPGQEQSGAAATAAPEQGWKLTKPNQVTFDRLAVWHGDQQTEHQFGKKDDDMDPEDKTETPETGKPDAEDKREGTPYALVAAGGPNAPSIPWHGVLTIEGKPSGDKRSFKKGALRHRDLPMRLTWQRQADSGHKGNVVVATIENLYRASGAGDEPNQIRGTGHFLQSDDADEVIGQAAEFGNLGVSVDVDDAAFEFDAESETTTFTDARISAACIVTIPAFAEAVITLGEPPAGFMGEPVVEIPDNVALSDTVRAAMGESFISDKPWNGAASRFTPEQWKASCILHLGDGLEKSNHKLPIKEPGGELSRAGVHAAASRIGQVDAPAGAVSSAKSALRGAYRQLGEQPPFELIEVESLGLPQELLDQFARGPGWITDPEATARIHAYWTDPGEPGYAKIAWGTEGDFNRCVSEIGQEIAEKNPQKLRYIKAQCAQWQHDAIGVWPGPHERLAVEGAPAPALSLVASVSGKWPVANFKHFTNPEFTELTPIQMFTEGGRTYVRGHMANWNECHLDFPGVCITPPPLYDNGLRFMCGSVETDQGRIATGCLTLGGGHADVNLGWLAAKEHYDDVSTAVADVVVGEDQFGYWFAGALRPFVTDEQRFQLYAAKLSGDWRDVGGQTTLIASHAVNTPGFLVPQAHVVNGRQLALVAAGGVQGEPPVELTGEPSIINISLPNGEVVTTTGVSTFRAGPPPDISEAVTEGIRRYRESSAAAATIEKIAVEANMTPPEQMARIAEQIGEH